jgi:glycerol dehydrogenase
MPSTSRAVTDASAPAVSATATRIFAGPSRYYQGPRALDVLSRLTAAFPGPAALVTDEPVAQLLSERIAAMPWDCPPLLLRTGAEVTYAAVSELEHTCSDRDIGVVVGLGGGKVLDTAKALATRLGVPVITAPTIASNDSPTSSAIAMYDADHHLIAVDMMAANPIAVVVDTGLLAQAPRRFLRSGIGDAIAKVFEANGCMLGTGLTPLGTRPLMTGAAIGAECYRVLREDSLTALADPAQAQPSDAFERVVEAVVLMSGLAFENGGLSLAHALTRGLMRVDGARDLLHGYHVAWGALVQLAAEGRDEEELHDLAGFLSDVGLPTCSSELGLREPWPTEHEVIADFTMTAPHILNLPVNVDRSSLITAIRRVDDLAARKAR